MRWIKMEMNKIDTEFDMLLSKGFILATFTPQPGLFVIHWNQSYKNYLAAISSSEESSAIESLAYCSASL